MKSIFLSEFVKQHKELYDKIYDKFKDKHRKEGLWAKLAASRNLSVNTVKTQCTRYGKLNSDEVRTSC